jgi:hypothetical protein
MRLNTENMTIYITGVTFGIPAIFAPKEKALVTTSCMNRNMTT